MPHSGAQDRPALVSTLTAAIGHEIAIRPPDAAIAWPNLPDVRAMVGHVGGIHRWVTAVVRTRGPVRERDGSPPPGDDLAWFEAGRAALLEALTSTPAEEPCWVLGDRTGTVAFWQRRMVFENAKHLMDLRSAGGGGWHAAPELAADDYADGIDELLAEFLPRSRPRLAPLPAPVVLESTDRARRWRIGRDWDVDPDPGRGEEDTRVLATTSDLALAMWERADLLDAGRFRVEGDPTAVAALAAARIHPW